MKVILYSLVFLLLFSCDNTNSKKEAFNYDNKTEVISNKSIAVDIVIIKAKSFQKQIIANGKIEALNKSELRFKTSERIASIKVKNGQNVSKGQTLAILDNSLLENQYNKAKIELDKAKAKLLEEKINFGSIDSIIDPVILKNLKIKSGYLEAENTLENAQLLYNQTLLRAPFSGVVANLESKIGDYITSSDVFCTVIAQQKLEVIFSVLENELTSIKKNQAVSMSSFVNENKSYNGVITEINPIVDENGLIRVKAKINTPDNTLFDGMHTKVTINQPINNAIVIPKEALVLRSNKEVVFTLENRLAKWNYVERLDENSKSYAIKKGLKLGDTIIVSGNINLSHDAKVNATFVK